MDSTQGGDGWLARKQTDADGKGRRRNGMIRLFAKPDSGKALIYGLRLCQTEIAF